MYVKAVTWVACQVDNNEHDGGFTSWLAHQTNITCRMSGNGGGERHNEQDGKREWMSVRMSFSSRTASRSTSDVGA